MITTTHAKPLTSGLVAAGLFSTRVAFCSRCSRVLGVTATDAERILLEHHHHCSPSLPARQPSIAVPFS